MGKRQQTEKQMRKKGQQENERNKTKQKTTARAVKNGILHTEKGIEKKIDHLYERRAIGASKKAITTRKGHEY